MHYESPLEDSETEQEFMDAWAKMSNMLEHQYGMTIMLDVIEFINDGPRGQILAQFDWVKPITIEEIEKMGGAKFPEPSPQEMNHQKKKISEYFKSFGGKAK